MFKLNGAALRLDRDLVFGEAADAITIPAMSLQDAATREQYGITEEPDQPRPDDQYHWVTDNGDGTFTAVPKDLDGLRKSAIAVVKQLRQASLDTFPRSAGVGEIYAENVAAAQALQSGAGTTTIMRNGLTAEAYIGQMAGGMGITSEQFVAYVLAENAQSATRAAEIEREYVRLAYTFIPSCTFEEVQSVLADYQNYCSERVGQ